MSPRLDSLRCLPFLLFLLLSAPPLSRAADDPPVPDGTKEAEAKLAAFRAPPGVKVELFAAEPKLGGPVAISLDEKGRVFVSEEYRFNRGTEENRTRPFFLDDDLQIRTLDDRLAMFRKFANRFEGGMDWFSRWSDQVRMVEDRDGDGRADHSTVFAGGFNEPLAGLAEGVLARDGDVYFTCIPHLWRLRDKDGDGVADEREKLLTGFGVNCAFLGHDLHGLSFGPDGKLYFSIGDRGFHVTTKEGTVLSGPRTGAVFRCRPDGTQLEVVHRGLRNPQELAWDECGNLFAVDNNCDKGDHSRLVYVVEGGESGWNMAYQTIPEPYLTGPWHAEKLWHLEHEGQAAYIVPPVGKLGAGPSGFAWYSHGALPEKFRGRFFYCNYTGNGGIETFRVQPKGAAFELVDMQDFLKPLSATDVEFGYDGKLYTSDFVQLIWEGGNRKGRIYTAFEPEKLTDPQVVETREAFKAGFKTLGVERLAELLRHPDYRTRLAAQFELAGRTMALDGNSDALKSLTAAAVESKHRPERLHGLWGLGQAAELKVGVLATIGKLLTDSDSEIRAHAARLCGDLRIQNSQLKLLELLQDPEPRVRYFAIQSLGKLRHEEAIPRLMQLAETGDVYLRHAVVIAMSHMQNRDAVEQWYRSDKVRVRMAAILIWRRWRSERSAPGLRDVDPYVIAEAARVMHDVIGSKRELSAMVSHASPKEWGDAYEPITRRAIAAAFRTGPGSNGSNDLVRFVLDPEQSLEMRREALAAVSDMWVPGPRDRVTGEWRLPRDTSTFSQRDLKQALTQVILAPQHPLREEALKLASKVNLNLDEPMLAKWAEGEEVNVETQIVALTYLTEKDSPLVSQIAEKLLRAMDPRLRSAARRVIVRREPERGAKLLQGAVERGELSERQAAITALAENNSPVSVTLFTDRLTEARAGKLPRVITLDVLEAARKHVHEPIRKMAAEIDAERAKLPLLGRFELCLEGGDAEEGRKVFFQHARGECVRCHKLESAAGTAGPELTGIGAKATREHLLESLLVPAAKIAPGFGTVTLTFADGRLVAGVIQGEDKETLRLATPQGKLETIDLADIEDRSAPTSAMPSVEKVLTPRELRDLIEFLASQKK